MLFFRPKKAGNMSELDRALQQSFYKVKQDTTLMFQWIQYLSNRQQNAEMQLKRALSYLPSHDEVRKLVDTYYEYSLEDQKKQRSTIQTEIELLKTEMNAVRRELAGKTSSTGDFDDRFKQLEDKISEIRTQLATPQQPASMPPAAPVGRQQVLKEKIFRSITRNSKDYVKNLVLNTIRKYQKISGLQLRVMIVEEQGLASKSSFYRILEEIEKDTEDISVFWEGKEKVYLYKVAQSSVKSDPST
jgi:chromosome segregation ATPase